MSKFIAQGGHAALKPIVLMPFAKTVKHFGNLPKFDPEKAHDHLNKTVFEDVVHPLEDVFNVKNPDVLRYFERNAEEGDLNSLKDFKD
jgi:hypothetical protein